MIIEFSSLNFSNAFSLPYSLNAEIDVAKNTVTAIPNVSNILESWNKKSIFIARAINKILIIGSLNDSITNFRKVFFFLEVNLLLPYLLLLFITSLSVRPILIFVFICSSIKFIKRTYKKYHLL